MRCINTETFEPYADVIAADCPENPPAVPEHCHPVTATFRYTSDGDYQMYICFEDHVKLPCYEPDQWHLVHLERELFTIIPFRLNTLDYYA